MALVNLTIATWTALMSQYAFLSFIVAILCYIAVLALEPVCEWPRRYYAVYAAGGAASVFTYIYAVNKAASSNRLRSVWRDGWGRLRVP
jgi:hypothetical protein